MTFNNQETWDKSFKEQIESAAYNTSPIEVIARNTSYYLRARYKPTKFDKLKFLEVGCGAGVNMAWLSNKGVSVSGIDISEEALNFAKLNLERAGIDYDDLTHASATKLPYGNDTFNGVVESCVIQHISNDERQKAFDEINRVLKPGGVFIGHVLNQSSTKALRMSIIT